MKKARAKKADAGHEGRDFEPEKINARADKHSGTATNDDGLPAGQVEEASTPPQAEPDTPPDELTVEQLSAKVVGLENSLLRAKADYQNLKRRAALDQSEAIRYANAELIKSLLTVLDDFDRSLAAAESVDKSAAIVDGVRLVHENLIKALREHGLSPISAVGEPFDPTVHDAVMMQPSEDYPDKTVIEEVARGYRLRDRVIRPAKVIVSKAAKQDPAEQETEGETEQEAKA